MRRGADWLGWVLQFIFGSFAGAFLGFALIARRRHSGWMLDVSVVPHFILGAGLLGAALASHYGDRLWMDYRVIPPDSPDQSALSVALSILTGAVGVSLMGFALLRHFAVL